MKFSNKIFLFLILSACGYKAPPPGKPDFEAPEIRVLNLKDKDTIRKERLILIEVKDDSRIKWVKMSVNEKDYSMDTIPPYEFFLSPPDRLLRVLFSVMDIWENQGNIGPFEIYGPFVDTLKGK